MIYSGLGDWLDLGLNFRHLRDRSSGSWKTEERLHLNATLKFKLKGYDISNRGRFEYRIREKADDFWRYRNKLSVKLPLKITVLEIQPYFADEIFADFDLKEMTENRLYTGFYFKITEFLNAEIFYMWRRIKSSGEWNTHDVLGTRLKFTF